MYRLANERGLKVMRELPINHVKEMAPHIAYKFVYERMPPDAIKAIEKCFAKKLAVEDIANYLVNLFIENGHPVSEGLKLFIKKSLEHHYFLWSVENGTFKG